MRQSDIDGAIRIVVHKIFQARHPYLAPHPSLAGHPGQQIMYDSMRREKHWSHMSPMSTRR